MKVEVVSYDPAWPECFLSEKAAITHVLWPQVLRIHHIGSTAVPGLAAKPVIDMLLEAESLEALDQKSAEFEALGYEVMGEFGMPGRRYFRKGGYHRTHQVHAFLPGDANVARHLAFRDYLRHFPAVCQEYARIKQSLAQACPEDIEGYNDGKDAFVKHHEAQALAWRACTAPDCPGD